MLLTLASGGSPAHAGGAPSPEQIGALTVSQVMETATRQSASVASAQRAVETALAQQRAAGASLLPVVLLSGGTSQAGSAEAGTSSAATSAQVKLSTSVPVASWFGRPVLEIRKAQRTLASARRDLALARESAGLTALTAAYNFLKSENTLRLAQESLRKYELFYSDTKLRRNKGMATEVEVMKAASQVASAQESVQRAGRSLALARMRLNQAIGQPLDSPVTLSAPSISVETTPSLEQLLDRALAGRPEIAQAQDRLQEAFENASLSPSPRSPKASFSAAFTTPGADVTASLPTDTWIWGVSATLDVLRQNGSQAPGSLPRSDNGWSAGVQLTWSLYDGGRSAESDVQNNLQIAGLESAVHQARQTVELDVQQAYAGLLDAIGRVRSTRESLEVARESVRITRLQVEAGVSSPRDLLDTELALLQAEMDAQQALWDYAVAKASLDKASGTSLLASISTTGGDVD